MIDQAASHTPPRPATPGAPADGPVRPRIALAHDWLCGYRGGVAVLVVLIVVFFNDSEITEIYTMFADGRPLTSAIDALPRRVSPVGRLPAANRLRRWMLPLYPAAVASLSRTHAADHARTPIDLVLSTSSAAIKGLRPPAGVPHLCYIHAPARYLWSLTAEYGRAGPMHRLGLAAFGPALRNWDRATAANVTNFLANSTHTAAEVDRCYGRGSIVLHPPVDTEFFTPPPPGRPRSGWLIASALEPYKRIDLAIAAARAAGEHLTIIGGGSEGARLRRLAAPGIEFRGRVSREELRAAYQSARLFLFPQIEDFGIAAVEALACGTPVAAFAAGGALDILGGDTARTGVLINSTDPAAFAAAARGGPDADDPAVSAACRAAAERFSRPRFIEAARRAIEQSLGAGRREVAESARRPEPAG